METKEMTIVEIFEYLDGCIEAFEYNDMKKTEFLNAIKELTGRLKLDILDLLRKYPQIIINKIT